MSTLPEIIDEWLFDTGYLNHFRLIRYSFTWIMCQCMIDNHECYYRVCQNRVEVYGDYKVDYVLSPADPQFFDKLSDLLTPKCKVAKAYANNKALPQRHS